MRSFLTLFFLLSGSVLQAQQRIGLIELFGKRSIPDSLIRNALHIKEGDSTNNPYYKKETLLWDLKSLPAIKNGTVEPVCCAEGTQDMILYVGVTTESDRPFVYRTPPEGKVSLPDPVLQAYSAYQKEMEQAVLKGIAEEDHDKGYALMKYAPAREAQMRFIKLSRKYYVRLKAVLHDAADAQERAIAAQVLAYGPDKEANLHQLLYAIYDKDETVRNNATRAIWVLAGYLNKYPQKKLNIPSEPFIQMLNSLVWTDRNKGILVLFALTEQKNDPLLATLKEKALPSLIEMAQWRNKGHALQAYFILGRIAGYGNDVIYQNFSSDKRQAFLQEVTQKSL